jgi:hypothetical protein
MGRELMIEIGNIPRDNIPPLGKSFSFTSTINFPFSADARVIRSTEIEKCARPARHISLHQDAVDRFRLTVGSTDR